MNIQLKFTGNISSIEQGLSILAPRLGIELSDKGIEVSVKKIKKGLVAYKKGDSLSISYGSKTDFFRAMSLLSSAVKENKDIDIFEEKQFDTIGSMIDVSRGHVYNVKTVFDLIERMALMGLNMFMLYTEDTYTMEKYPWFGYMRGRYSVQELKAIDDHACTFGIEVIPCIQTLGHLATFLKWTPMNKVKDTASLLLVGKDETYELIEEMIKTMRECFRSNRIHIGLDETHGLGTGNFLDDNAPASEKEIFVKHIKKVCRITKKYKYHPMMWSDMFFRFSGQRGEYDLSAEIPMSLKTELPHDLELVYWDYCMEKESITDTVIGMHNAMERPVAFAGGIWTWNRFINCYKKGYDTAKSQLKACKKNNLSTVFATIWNNSYSYNSLYSILPSLQVWAELGYDVNADDEKIKNRYKACTGYDLDTWKAVFIDDFTDEERERLNPKGAFCINSSFQHFFNDVLVGLLDKTLSGYDFKSRYEKALCRLDEIDAGDMQDLFDRQKTLIEIVYHKSDIGPRLRRAYKDKDNNTMKEILAELEKLLVLYEKFHTQTLDMWYKLCKPFGNNSLDEELAAAEARVKTAIYRVKSYLDGRTSSLDELDEEVMYFNEQEKPLIESWNPKSFMSAL